MAQHLKFFFSKSESLIIGLVFSFNSLLFGNWVTRIPHVKDAIGLSESELGLALLGAPVGALCVMPVAGWIIAHFRLGRTIFMSAVLLALTLPLLALADTLITLTVSLFFFGLFNSIMDISMNAAAASTERKLEKPIMSTCHGMWSVGAMVGSGAGSILVGFDLSTIIHLSLVAVVIIVWVIFLRKKMVSYSEEKQPGQRMFAIPNWSLLLLSFMAFCIMTSEGGVADWSAIYMRDSLGANAFLTGVAYAGFSLLMAIGRMMGDYLIPRIGKRNAVMWGGLLAAFGLTVALVVPSPIVAIVGFSIAGFGYSCIVPVLFIAASNEPGYSSGTGIAAITTIGYAGFLVGPPFIGFLAEAFTLAHGMGFIVFCSLMVSLLSFRIRFK